MLLCATVFLANSSLISISHAASTDPAIKAKYNGPIVKNYYGKPVPKHAHGTENFDSPTSVSSLIIEATQRLFDRIVNPELLIRRLNLTVNHVIPEDQAKHDNAPQQLDLFTDYEAEQQEAEQKLAALEKERRMQGAQLAIRQRFGKNALLRGMSYTEGATQKQRNEQIGGHKA